MMNYVTLPIRGQGLVSKVRGHIGRTFNAEFGVEIVEGFMGTVSQLIPAD